MLDPDANKDKDKEKLLPGGFSQFQATFTRDFGGSWYYPVVDGKNINYLKVFFFFFLDNSISQDFGGTWTLILKVQNCLEEMGLTLVIFKYRFC